MNALVPAGGGHVALYCNEAPGVWFFDFVRIPAEKEVREAALDPLFVEACEPGSLFVQSVSEPVEVFLSDDQTRVYESSTTLELVVAIYGVRRGFADVRLTRHTESQYNQNLRFWGRAFTSLS